jgi:hypothetical protein
MVSLLVEVLKHIFSIYMVVEDKKTYLVLS